MNGKELRRMSRGELLQALIERTRENAWLREKLTDAQSALEQAKAELADRTMALTESGSIAEAALKINGVFEDAQQAAGDYLNAIQQLKREQEQKTGDALAEAQRQAEEILQQARAKSAQMEKDAQRRCDELIRIAERDARHNWDEMDRRMKQLSEDNAALREMLQGGKKRKWL